MILIDKEKLGLIMAEKCVSVGAIAETSGLSSATITRIKSGAQMPRPQTIGKIAKALNVDVKILLR